jgi:Zn-dependent peptidase ImmA (M78 family)
MELHGFILVRESVECADMDAVSSWQAGRPYVLFSSDVSSGPRNTYNLAHELGHMLLHSSVDVSSENIAQIEKQADRFASAFLLPQETFSREVLGTSLDHFLFLKEKWGVSIAAMAYRCHELETINSNQFSYIFRQLNIQKVRKNEPLDVREPSILSGSIRMLLDRGVQTKMQIEESLALNLSDIESLCGLTRGHLDSRVVPFMPSIKKTEI